MDLERMIARVAARAAMDAQRTDMARMMPLVIGPPLDPADLPEIEAALGFPLPDAIREVYRRIGNGGFGPGYGLMRLQVTDRRAFAGNAVAVLNFLRMAHADDDDGPGPGWPPAWLPVVHLGCSLYVCVACDKADLPVFVYDVDRPDADDGKPVRDTAEPKGHGFVEWLDGWGRFA